MKTTHLPKYWNENKKIWYSPWLGVLKDLKNIIRSTATYNTIICYRACSLNKHYQLARATGSDKKSELSFNMFLQVFPPQQIVLH